MIHEYTFERYDTFADLMTMRKRCARNKIIYPICNWRRTYESKNKRNW